MDAIDEAWASHDAMRAAVDEFREAATVYLDGSAVPDLPAERRLLDLARAAAAHLAVPFETAPDQDAAHLEYEQLKAENAQLRAALHQVAGLEAESAFLKATISRLAREIGHLRAALNRMRDLGHGMSRSWYVREIEDGLTFPPSRNDQAATHFPVGAEQGAPRLQPGEER